MCVRRRLAFMGIAMAVLGVSPAADAFCRKSTDSPSNESFDPAAAGNCGDKPDALPLYWSEGCIEYKLIIDQDLIDSKVMTESRAGGIVDAGTSAWMDAECPLRGGKGVSAPAIRTVEVDKERCPDAKGATQNEIHFTSQPPPGEALALTDVTYDLGTGKMLLATTRIFNVYARLGQTPEEVDKALGYVVKHEVGHFLGLAHSEHTDAVMYASYRSHQNGALSDDDTAAICNAYNPESPIGAGCAVARAEPRAGWPIALAAAWIAVRGRRRKDKTSGARTARRAAFGLAAAFAMDAPEARGAEVTSRPVVTVPVEALPRAGEPAKPKPKPTRKTRRKPLRKPVKRATGWWMVRTIVLRREDPNAPPPAPVPAHAEEPPKPAPTPAPSQPPRPPAPAPSAAPPGLRYDPGVPGKDAPAGQAKLRPKGAVIYAGARYRAFVLPQPVFNVVGRGGKTLLFQSVAIEGDYRKGAFSIVPALSFADLSSGDMLVGSHSSDLTSSFAYVRSDMKAIAASVALAWSFPMSDSLAFELGFELGLGFAFGSLIDNWVTESPDGALTYNGRHFKPCLTAFDGVGCSPQEHASPTPQKVGNYVEPSIFSGGKAPTLLPWVSLPLVGVRAQLSDQIAMRVGLGASFTGVWAGASFDYAVAR
jgi:Matrixin